MGENIEGKWILKSIEGLEAFCKEFASKIQQEEHHTIEYEKKDDKKWVQTSLFGNNFLQALWLMDYGPQEFKSGEEFVHKDLSGSDSRSTICVEGNKVVQVQKVGQGSDGLYELTTERVFNGDKMTTTFTYKGEGATDASIVIEFERVK